MESFKSSYPIFIENPLEALVAFIDKNYPNGKRFVLADQNTLQYCLPAIEPTLAALKVEPQVFNIDPGEESKSLDMAYQLWENFTDLHIQRTDVIINIGGGVVSDLGGFVAATYKRGVDVINVPTSLLAMADASVGGKVGINFHQLKNHLGYFSMPKAVCIYPQFLNTLPDREFISGYAEMIKHALIADAEMWKVMLNQKAPSVDFVAEILPSSIAIKDSIVAKDPLDKGVRKTLNFGHTLGHAIETLFMDSDTKVLHGEAVAAGMVCAAYISMKQNQFPENQLEELTQFMLTVFDLEFVTWLMPENLSLPLKHDKKNADNELKFVLLSEIGKPVYNQSVPMDLALEAFSFLQEKVHETI